MLFLFVLLSCKKYPEGPCISFRSAKSRFYGYHTLTALTDNGVDELSQYYDSLSLRFDFYYTDVDQDYVCNMNGDRKDGWESTLIWTWELINDDKVLKITSSGGNRKGWSWGPFKNNVLPEWQILRLEKKDIRLTTTYNGKVYNIELK